MPPVSEKQRRAMAAAAGGESSLGIPQGVGAEFMAADPGGKLPKAKGKGKGGKGKGLQALVDKGKKRPPGYQMG